MSAEGGSIRILELTLIGEASESSWALVVALLMRWLAAGRSAYGNRSTNNVGQGGDRPNTGATRFRVGHRVGDLVAGSDSSCTRG